MDHLVDHFILDALSHVDGTVHVRYLLAVRHVFDVVAQMLHLRLQIVVLPHVDLSEILDVADGLKSAPDSLVFDHHSILGVSVHLTLQLIISQFQLFVLQIKSGDRFAELNDIQGLSREQLSFHINDFLITFGFDS